MTRPSIRQALSYALWSGAVGTQGVSSAAFGSSGDEEATTEDAGPRWFFLPVSDYLGAPGVESVMRAATYPSTAVVVTGRHSGVFMGIERASFPQISYWRDDFASQSLGGLMNELALQRNGVLVPDIFLSDNLLTLGMISALRW